MIDYLAMLAPQLVAGVLVYSSAGHVSDFKGLYLAVADRHLGLPPRLLAMAIILLELGLGVAIFVGTWADMERLLIVGLGGAFALMTAYALDTARLVASDRRVPCGCGGANTPVSWPHACRAALLGFLAVWSILTGAHDEWVGGSLSQHLVALISGLALAVLCMHMSLVWEEPGRVV